MTGTVYFIGAGPGAPDLLTLRAQRIIQRADLVIFADSLVHPEVAKLARPDADVIGSSTLTLEQITEHAINAARKDKIVARLQSGDPSIYGALHEQLMGLRVASVPFEIVPGVSSAFAAAAGLGVELTVPGVTQTVIFTRTAGRTGPLPEGEDLADLARHGASLALFLSTALLDRSVPALIEGGYPPDTPTALVYRATWEDEQVIRGPLSEMARLTHDAGITKQALLLVGAAVDPEFRRGGTERSHLYDPTYSHGRRVAKRRDRRAATPESHQPKPLPLGEGASIASHGARDGQPKRSVEHSSVIPVVAASRRGIETAGRIAGALARATVFVPSTAARFIPDSDHGVQRSPKPLSELVGELFESHVALVLVLATGAAVRLIAPLLRDKRVDPAVVVVDDAGQFAISLVGGHRAEANDLAEQVAQTLGARAVVTTASDTLGQPSVERLLTEHQLTPDPDGPAMTRVAAALVNGDVLGLMVEPGLSAIGAALGDLGTRTIPAIDLDSLAAVDPHAALVVTDRHVPSRFERFEDRWLVCRPRSLIVGVGCSSQADPESVRRLVEDTLEEASLSPRAVAALATIDRRASSPAILPLAEGHGWPVRAFSAGALDAVPVPTPSAAVRDAVGTASVCEAAALLAAEGGEIIVTKRHNAVATVAVARRRLTDA